MYPSSFLASHLTSILLSRILFIKIINESSFLTDTRETAVVNSLLAAGAGRRIAAACRDEKLPNCTCKVDGTNGVVNNTYITYDCSYNGDVAEKLLLDFFEESNTTDYQHWNIVKKVENRNHKIGFNVSKHPLNCDINCKVCTMFGLYWVENNTRG